MTARWLTQSRSCPLSIETGYFGDDASASPLLSRIFAEAARVEDLKLQVCVSNLHALAACLPATSCPMPQLRRLDLHMLTSHSEASVELLLFSDTPQLRSVVLNDIAALHIRLPWAQLTTVSLHNVYPHECVPVLRQTPNLLHCKLTLYADIDDIPELMLPSLQSLTLQRYDEEAVIGYLDSLTLPALHILSIPEPFLGDAPIDVLTCFIKRSGCRLQELCLTEKIQDPPIYREAFPLISRLTLRGWRFTGGLHTANSVESINEVSDLVSESGL
ncbi:hypothetical protein C8R46DRAFT_436807 [Mycena filopes]|nr:hypothetical protein C8R46DRAFT_436807 [Mycena filopes]